MDEKKEIFIFKKTSSKDSLFFKTKHASPLNFQLGRQRQKKGIWKGFLAQDLLIIRNLKIFLLKNCSTTSICIGQSSV